MKRTIQRKKHWTCLSGQSGDRVINATPATRDLVEAALLRLGGERQVHDVAVDGALSDARVHLRPEIVLG